MANIHLISDTHFNQGLMIRFGNRPFKNKKEMNEKIIYNWNKVVKENDIVLILGDLGQGSLAFFEDLFQKLKGIKILIQGNHDNIYRILKLNKIKRLKIMKELTLSINNKKIIFSHKPLKKRSFDLLFHGHFHRKKLPSNLDQDKHFNAAVEHLNYKPKLLKDVLIEKNIDIDVKKIYDYISNHIINNENRKEKTAKPLFI